MRAVASCLIALLFAIKNRTTRCFVPQDTACAAMEETSAPWFISVARKCAELVRSSRNAPPVHGASSTVMCTKRHWNACSNALPLPIMQLRRRTVEYPFALLKYAIFGHPRFLLRGLEGARCEMALAVMVYNFKRMLNLIGA